MRTSQVYLQRILLQNPPKDLAVYQNHLCSNLHLIWQSDAVDSVPHTTPVASTCPIISSQEARWCSSIIDATRMRSGYSFSSCCNSASIVSNGRSLMSSMFSHPITSDLVPACAHTFNFAYLGVTFITYSESSDTWIENKRQLLDDDELPPPYTEILETLRSAESWIQIPLEFTHNIYIISSNLHKQSLMLNSHDTPAKQSHKSLMLNPNDSALVLEQILRWFFNPFDTETETHEEHVWQRNFSKGLFQNFTVLAMTLPQPSSNAHFMTVIGAWWSWGDEKGIWKLQTIYCNTQIWSLFSVYCRTSCLNSIPFTWFHAIAAANGERENDNQKCREKKDENSLNKIHHLFQLVRETLTVTFLMIPGSVFCCCCKLLSPSWWWFLCCCCCNLPLSLKENRPSFLDIMVMPRWCHLCSECMKSESFGGGGGGLSFHYSIHAFPLAIHTWGALSSQASSTKEMKIAPVSPPLLISLSLSVFLVELLGFCVL